MPYYFLIRFALTLDSWYRISELLIDGTRTEDSTIAKCGIDGGTGSAYYTYEQPLGSKQRACGVENHLIFDSRNDFNVAESLEAPNAP